MSKINKNLLSELITIKNSISHEKIKIIHDIVINNANLIEQQLSALWPFLSDSGIYSNNMLEYSQISSELKNILPKLSTSLNNIELEIINDILPKYQKKYLNNSYNEYTRQNQRKIELKQNLPDEMLLNILERFETNSMYTDADTVDILIGRIKLLSNWKYPAMQIRPGLCEITQHMTSFDPLYIVDEDPKLLTHLTNVFNNQYLDRIRTKTINELQDDYFNDTFPAHQLALIIVTDFFNYKPFEVIQQYLKLFKNKLLKPGGRIIFTFNDCDLPSGIQNAEHYMNTYTPSSLLKSYITYLGYEIINIHSSDTLSWMEILLPGSLCSIRGGQCIAKINK